MKLYTREELKQQQADGSLAVSNFPSFEKYEDRWEKASKLMSGLDLDYYLGLHTGDAVDEVEISDWQDDEIPDKSFAVRHSGPIMGFDIDTMIGPKDWYRDKKDDQKVGDYVIRKKLYLYEWTQRGYDKYLANGGERNEELEFFLEMHRDYKPILDHYYQQCFVDQQDSIERLLHKMMIIEYSHPTADDSNITEHRKHNTERFGDSHCDETLCGIHMGENIQEFEALNTCTDEWMPVNLTGSEFLFFFSEHGEQSGWKPTYHRMIHQPNTELQTRYVIIFDLQARYKGEE